MIYSYTMQLSIRYVENNLCLIKKVKKKCRWENESETKKIDKCDIDEKGIFNKISLSISTNKDGVRYLVVLFEISNLQKPFSEIEKRMKKEIDIPNVKNRIDICVFEIHFTKYITGNISEVFESIKKYRNTLDSLNKKAIIDNQLIFSCNKTTNEKKTEISLTKPKKIGTNMQESTQKIELVDEYPFQKNYIRLDLRIYKDQIIWKKRQNGNTVRSVKQIFETGFYEELEYYYFNMYISQIFGLSNFVSLQTAREIIQNTSTIKQIGKKQKINNFLIKLNDSLYQESCEDIDQLWKIRKYKDYITLDLEEKLNINPRLLPEDTETIDNFLKMGLENWKMKLDQNKRCISFQDSKKNLIDAILLTQITQFGRVFHESDNLTNYIDRNGLTKSEICALNAALNGFNLFISGGAGTGKSYIVNKLSSVFKQNGKKVLLCAPTGIAADNINGITIHQALKFHWINTNIPIVDFSEIPKNTDIVIVDEISMCRCDLFDSLILSIVKSCYKYNKKIQLIVIGDFYQLPPVLTLDDKEILDSIYEKDISSGYAFMGKTWDFCNFKYIELQESQRQTDHEFIRACNRLRVGDSTAIKYFNKYCSKEKNILEKDNIVYISSYKKDIQEVNDTIHSHADSYPVIFTINDKGDNSCYEFDMETNKFSNQKGHYCNGMMGRYIKKYISAVNEEYAIVYVKKKNIYLAVKERSYKIPYMATISKEAYSIRYREEMKYPFEKAYAITIHKSQGMTIDKVLLSPKNFTNGQLYVALTRCKDVSDIYLKFELTAEDVKCDKKVSDFYNRLSSQNMSKLILKQNCLIYPQI